LTDDGFRVVGRRPLAERPFLQVEEVDVASPDGTLVQRVIVHTAGAVAMVPVIDDRVVLIRQHRAAIGEALLEIPAGKLDVVGEDRVAAATRELGEEVGYLPGKLEPLAEFYTTPGFSDERIWVYLATDLTPTAVDPQGPEERAAEIVEVPISELPSLLPDLRDGKTLVGLLALLRLWT